MWNGSVSQVNGFLSVTGITFPCLLNAGAAGVGTDYACTYHIFFVVDADGVITYRQSGWDETGVRNAIDAALADLATDAPPTAARGFELAPAYPNPFNPSTTLAFSLEGDGDVPVELRITDLRGRTVRTLVSGRLAAGREYAERWDGLDDTGRPATSGTYLSVLRVGGETQSRFMTLVK